jgi:hypothetical protein
MIVKYKRKIQNRIAIFNYIERDSKNGVHGINQLIKRLLQAETCSEAFEIKYQNF